MFKRVKERLKELLKGLALPSVLYAEQLIGSGFGETKREVAITFILDMMPPQFKPFKKFIRKFLGDVLDCLVETAVEKLHELEKTMPEGFIEEF